MAKLRFAPEFQKLICATGHLLKVQRDIATIGHSHDQKRTMGVENLSTHASANRKNQPYDVSAASPGKTPNTHRRMPARTEWQQRRSIFSNRLALSQPYDQSVAIWATFTMTARSPTHAPPISPKARSENHLEGFFLRNISNPGSRNGCRFSHYSG